MPRDNLFYAQTPQGFGYKEIQETMSDICDIIEKELPSPTFTDDASLFEYLQKEVSIVPGSKKNFKITTEEDLQMAEAIYDT